jgi:CelD/BcsL family acetyltransferase involved in cellulose biosynthesis
MAVLHGDPLCCRTEWQLSACETMHPSFRPELLVAGDAVLAFARAHSPRLGAMLVPFEASWCYGCPLLGEGAVDALAQWLDALRGHGERPAVVVTGMAPDGATLSRIEREFARSHEVVAGEVATQCVASLDGGLDGYLSRRSSHFRRRLRQADRRARGLGVDFERCAPSSVAEASAVYARMTAVEARSWKGLADCGMNTGASLPFYGRMLARLAVGGLARVMFARHDDKDVGFVYGGLVDGVYRGQQFSYDEQWHAHSLGNLLQLAQLTWLGEERARRYDLGPHMPYKERWAETTVAMQTRLLLSR